MGAFHCAICKQTTFDGKKHIFGKTHQSRIRVVLLKFIEKVSTCLIFLLRFPPNNWLILTCHSPTNRRTTGTHWKNNCAPQLRNEVKLIVLHLFCVSNRSRRLVAHWKSLRLRSLTAPCTVRTSGVTAVILKLKEMWPTATWQCSLVAWLSTLPRKFYT